MKKVYLVVTLDECFDFDDEYMRRHADCRILAINSVETSLKDAKRSFNFYDEYSSLNHAILVYSDGHLIDFKH